MVRNRARPDQDSKTRERDHHLHRRMQCVRHKTLFIGETIPALPLAFIDKIELQFQLEGRFLLHHHSVPEMSPHNPKVVAKNAKRPPGNRAASSLGRIVPTEARPSELSGEILWLAKKRVKAKSAQM